MPIAIITVPVISSTVIAAAVVAITVIASTVVIPAAPIRSVIPAIVGVPGIITVVGVGAVIAGSVEDRERDGESKGKANTGPRRGFREERQTSDRKDEDNELLHRMRNQTKPVYHEFNKSRSQE
jgi:hypothetical protein